MIQFFWLSQYRVFFEGIGKLVFRFAEGAYHECVFDFAVFKFDDISALNGFIITAKNRGGGV